MAKMDQSKVLTSFVGMTKPAMVQVGNSYKCSLCKKAGDYASLVPHIQTHSRNVLTYKGIEIYRCGLDCSDVPHHHCCYCNQSVVLKNVFIRHLKRCEECLIHKENAKQASSGDQKSGRTKAPSRPLANAPAMGIVVQTPSGPALLQTVTTPVRLQGTAGPLLLQATHLPLRTSTGTSLLLQTATASSPKQASTAKSSTTTTTTTSTSNNALTTASSQDDEPTTTSSPSQASELQTPNTAAMELTPDLMETSTDTTTATTATQPTTTSVTSSSADQASTGTPSEEQESSSANPGSPSHSPPSPASEMAETSQSKDQRRRIKCPHCPTVLFKRNLKVHIVRHHKDLPTPAPEKPPKRAPQLKSVSVDRKNGIVAVQRHARGFLAPVHAQRKVSGGQVVRCDLKECHQFQQMAKRHGLSVSHCQHTQDLDLCSETAPEDVLDQEVLDEMVVLKHLTDAKRAMCLRRQKMAQAAKIPFSVRVDLGGAPRHVFVSVHEPKTNDFSCLGRVMVGYNVERNVWQCPCAKPHISCLHKNIAKWHVFQSNRDLIKNPGISSREASVRGNVGSAKGNRAGSANGDIKRSVEYIYENKRIPPELPEDLTNTVFEFPAHLFPVETTCDFCSDDPSLEEAEIVTDQAKIVTMMGVADNISTYIRRCPDCQVLYRYQEWQDGLHNFDNHLILSIELCLYLRHSLQNQIPMSKAVQTLERLRKVRFPSADDLLNAYSHFEAMNGFENTDSAIDDNDCSPAIVTDLHRKAFLALHWG